MFTSRAEYRLNLRHDSADQRLTPKGFAVGLQSADRMERLRAKMERIDAIKQLLSERRFEGKSCLEALRRPEVTLDSLLSAVPELSSYDAPIRYQAELDVKYDGYIKRQERQVDRFAKLEEMEIPSDFDYDAIGGISAESREKFKQIRPRSIGQAGRISGVRNSDVAILMVYLGHGSPRNATVEPSEPEPSSHPDARDAEENVHA